LGKNVRKPQKDAVETRTTPADISMFYTDEQRAPAKMRDVCAWRHTSRDVVRHAVSLRYLAAAMSRASIRDFFPVFAALRLCRRLCAIRELLPQ